jgi:hypothetical protein
VRLKYSEPHGFFEDGIREWTKKKNRSEEKNTSRKIIGPENNTAKKKK